MKKNRFIEVKKSRKTGQWYWVMKGTNGRKMAHSEGIKNRTYFKQLMADFESIGFEIVWNNYN